MPRGEGSQFLLDIRLESVNLGGQQERGRHDRWARVTGLMQSPGGGGEQDSGHQVLFVLPSWDNG